MNSAATENWHEANQRCLTAALHMVRAILQRHAEGGHGTLDAEKEILDDARAAVPGSSSLERLCTAFGLSPFERDLLLVCAGIELDSTFASVCAAAQGDPRRTYPTFNLALAALPEPHWSALSPDRPLRYWRLIEVGTGTSLTLSPLRVDERVLHYLAGIEHLDERLAGLVDTAPVSPELAPSHRNLAGRIAAVWTRAAGVTPLPVVQLGGDDAKEKLSIAAAACAEVGLNLKHIDSHALPSAPAELDALVRLWNREAVLNGCALFLDCDKVDGVDATREHTVVRFIDGIRSPLVVAGRAQQYSRQTSVITLEVSRAAASEQQSIWQSALGKTAANLNGTIEALVAQFNLSLPAIHAACAEALGRTVPDGGDQREEPRAGTEGSTRQEQLGERLWAASRVQARPRMGSLAQYIEPLARWDDLVLPKAQKQMLREIVIHVRQRLTVYETWGFAAKSARGLGINALFVGVSGTGKTMAAEVLANELRLDLYHIDLSQVVSKYIGETEKNLRQVFDAAEAGSAVLLFDEADALFGKRNEVKDSHDRYANIEISYLLQRMETYRGLAVLTTNMKNVLDTAFLRRLRFIVQFPFPDEAHRTQIWRRIFPPETPTEGLDVNKLARLNVAGGNICNIAVNAAFLAADGGGPVGMAHLRRAARTEYLKLEKSLPEGEMRDWT